MAVDEERHGGSGDIWVADGYGESYVHRFDKSGRYTSSITGDANLRITTTPARATSMASAASMTIPRSRMSPKRLYRHA